MLSPSIGLLQWDVRMICCVASNASLQKMNIKQLPSANQKWEMTAIGFLNTTSQANSNAHTNWSPCHYQTEVTLHHVM